MSPDAKPSKPIDIYTRFSQVGSRDKGAIRTLEEQEEACRAQLKLDGLEGGLVFSDSAVSGGKKSRPAFDQVLERARSGESGGFIVYDLTRFGRYSTMANDIIELEKAGATIIAVKDKVDTSSPSSRAFLRIMEAMAVMYREQVEERLRVSQTNAVARGVHISPNVPPGYNRGKDGVLVPDPQHKVTMAQAFRMAAQGKSRSEIAKYLTKEKLPSAGHPVEKWAPSRIGRLLANPVYKGEARYGDLTNPKAHEAIIDPLTWARAQREQADPELLISEKSEWLLSGFVRCASCRYAMRTMPGRKSTIPVYRCHCTNAEAKCPQPVTISMTALDDLVYAEWVERIWETRVANSNKTEHDNSDAKAELEAANAAYEELQAAEDELDPLAYAKAETKIIDRIKQAEEAVSSFVPKDLGRMAEEAMPHFEQTMARIVAGESPLAGLPPEAIKLMRQAMARDIRAVFVRPAQTKGRGSKAEDRVKILWAGDDLPAMPRRGVTFTPTPYTWDEGAEAVA